jgi:hypothetical protein
VARVAGRDDRRRQAVAGACGGLAAAVAVWLVSHPSPSFELLFQRGDHLAFAGLVGLTLEPLSGRQRSWPLAAISLAVLLQYAGLTAVAVATALTGAGLGLVRALGPGRRPWTFVMHGALVVLAYAIAFRLRASDFLEAARVQGLLAFWSLRHVSLVAYAVSRQPPGSGECAAFMTFYPGAMGMVGAPEVYDEFARRNFGRRPALDHGASARRMFEGVLMLAASRLVPVSLADIEASPNPGLAWSLAIVFFVRTALAIMGIWRGTEGIALLYGVRLRRNFGGLLSCRNPSELWWAWRGTLTNWLVRHVYAPLGANRRHQSFNILAAFVVSFVWHAVGVPFIDPHFTMTGLGAVGLWAAINGCAVILYVRTSRTARPRLIGAIPPSVRIVGATVLTWALGSLTPILLAYQGAAARDLPRLLRPLLGLG